MQIIKRFFGWLVYSSTNANQYALSIKGIGVAVIPTLIAVLGLAHVQADQSTIQQLFEAAAMIVQYFLGFIAAIMTVVGIIRKLVSTLSGTNEVLAYYARQ